MPSATTRRFSLTFCIHFCLFLDRRRIVSSKFFNTQVSLVFTDELTLPFHALCVLSHLRCRGHSLLLSFYLSGIDRIENLSYSTCGYASQGTSYLILHCPGMDSLRHLILCVFTTSGPGPGELSGF